MEPGKMIRFEKRFYFKVPQNGGFRGRNTQKRSEKFRRALN
ncbi:hypothetical protein NIES2104_47760 [Leptolyngbya sp. NIES-2104]|nr:hypothetical protein NIES2104_47760 [Leptolyngbya sp. NIES-2104]